MAPPDWVREKPLTPDERIQRAKKRTAAILEKQDQEAQTAAPSKRAIPRMPFHSENGHIAAFTGSEASLTPRPNAPKLCGFCARSLRLDDGGLGGFLGDSWDGHQNTLCFTGGESGKMHTREYYCSESNSKRLDWCTGTGNSDDGYERCVKPPALPELVESCQFCSVTKKLILQRYGTLEWWNETEDEFRYSIQYRWSARRSSERELNRDAEIFKGQLMSVDIHVKHPKLPWGPEVIRLSVAMSPGPCRDWLGIENNPLTQVELSQATVEMIQGWIEDCENGRKSDYDPDNFEDKYDDACGDLVKNYKINEKYARDRLPDRLLDLGANEMCDPVLADSKAIPFQDIRYACLSYRWSQSMPVKTTRDTIDRHRQGIPLASLPQLLRDAVAVTRALGVRYLWIDVLCIVQDIVDDWARGSAMMANIFSHSWIILSAPMASSCDASLFGETKQLDGLHFRSSVNANISGDYSIDLFDDMFEPRTNCDTRAWTWKELEMQNSSPRLLVFGKRMIGLYCHRRIYSERGSLDKTFKSMMLPYQENLLSWWQQWVFDYSKRWLSNDYDKIAAVSGLVKRMHQQRRLLDWNCPSEYLVGSNFRGQIHPEPRLTFKGLTHPFLDKPAGHYVAPSWISAFCKQQTETSFRGNTHKDCFTLIRCNVEPPDHTGDATAVAKHGSTITLQGFVRLYPAQSTTSASTFVFARENFPGTLDTWKTKFRPAGLLRNSYIEFFLDWVPSIRDNEEGDKGSHFKLILLSCGGSPREATGLLLWQGGRTNGAYLKVGVFEIDYLYEWPLWVYDPDELEGWVKEEVTIM